MSFQLEDLKYDKDNLERRPWEHYKELYAKADPIEIANRMGFDYNEDKKEFLITFMNQDYFVSFPDFEVTSLTTEAVYHPLEELLKAKILVIRYLLEGVKTKSTGKFLTYRETPWGEVYLRQFRGRCILRLAFSYGNKLETFRKVMEACDAVSVKAGDMAYELELLPGYQVRMILWEGDDEFPPSAQILFSDNFPVCFQAEDMAVTGDVIIGSLKAIEKKL